MKITLPYLLHDKDRHGNSRLYFRRPGSPMIRLRALPGSDEFLEEYQRARQSDSAVQPAGQGGVAPQSLRALIDGYYASVNFQMLARSTQNARRRILHDICLSKTKNNVERGGLPFDSLEVRHIRELRDEKLQLPEAANGRVTALRQVFEWAIERGLTNRNPARPIRLLSRHGYGFHTWTMEEITAYEVVHPVGTKARLAMALLLYTGVRRSDVVKLGPHMERDGVLYFSETKGANSRALNGRASRRTKTRALPILPVLREAIDAAPSGQMTYLVTEGGRPFTVAGFGNRFRKWCKQANLKHCSAHGLRKAAATIAAENGATLYQLMSIFGWTSLRQAESYTRWVEQERLASEGITLLLRRPGLQKAR